MTRLILIGVVGVAALAGGGGGFVAKTSFLQQAATASSLDAKDADASHKTQAKEKTGHGASKSADVADISHMKFSRQFVVPVVRGGRPRTMMIFEISITLDGSKSDGAYAYEPQLRDAMLGALFELASDGTLERITEDREVMIAVKHDLLLVAQQILGETATDILLLDIGIQPY